MKKNSRAPQIGIFWIVDNQIIAFMQDIDEISDVAGYKDSKFEHITIWNKLQSAFPELKDLEYDELERGRITYNTNDRKFTIILSRKMMTNEGILSKIRREFSLPNDRTKVISDLHYTLPQNLKKADFE